MTASEPERQAGLLCGSWTPVAAEVPLRAGKMAAPRGSSLE